MMLYRKRWYNMESKLQTSMYTMVLFIVKKEVYTKTWWLSLHTVNRSFTGEWIAGHLYFVLCWFFPCGLFFYKKYKLYNQRSAFKHVCLWLELATLNNLSYQYSWMNMQRCWITFNATLFKIILKNNLPIPFC